MERLFMAKSSTQTENLASSDLVTYSRAGDTFHYRWAARRCLRLLDFNTNLNCITIEGSKESKLGGEYVMDTAEYSSNSVNEQFVEYFQLKHSTAQLDKNFTLSSLKDTIVGFSNRFRDLGKTQHNYSSVKFTIVTNRPISPNFKKSVINLAAGKSGGKQFDTTLESYTKLSGIKLSEFCRSLQLVDGEGDYDAQKHELHRELVRLTCEGNDTQPLLNLVELVRARIEPKSTTKNIKKDDVLEQFGLTTEKDLFPAPPLFESLPSIIEREQYDDLYRSILDSESSFLILKAVGGIGKSIACTFLLNRFIDGSFAVAYDCFGNGGYRKISEHRHRACDAYVQIGNQLAKQGLCEPMLPANREQDDRLTQGFLSRLSQAVGKLRKGKKNAQLVIFFDAVDNAEMAASEFGDRCFASYLLREQIPEGCRIVYFSRPERTYLFNPPAFIPQIEIKPFSSAESLQYLLAKFPRARLEDAIEFNRLTDANPRVQANTLALNKQSIEEVLAYLGIDGKTVDDLIEEQLKNAVYKIKELYPRDFGQHVDDICTGLATLPPFIPLEVLAAVSEIDVLAVKSFIADLGRPLWLTDNYVQFRDEPTEKWFTDTYVAKPEQIKIYIDRLEPLADKYSYVAEALPSLLLKSGQYDGLIELALSDDKLPKDNPIDARNIQVYRLQFAFKAALKNRQYADACKLALRAGEEVAGSDRQLEIVADNIDLAPLFLSEQRIMEIAHQRHISSAWRGSETLYSATLLSTILECEGEARSYLRSSEHWLQRYFEERKKENAYRRDNLKDKDVVAMLICYYQLDGEKAAVNFILRWRPEEFIYRVMREFSERFVDKAEYKVLERMALYGKDSPGLVIAINHELLKVGRTLEKKNLTRILNKISGPGKWLEKPKDTFNKQLISSSAYLSLLEACVINKLPLAPIRRALNYYTEEPKPYVISDNYHSEDRTNFFRSTAIRACLQKKYDFSIADVRPMSWGKEPDYHRSDDKLEEADQVIGILLPWYMVRAKLLAGQQIPIESCHIEAQEISSQSLFKRYREYDSLPFEITDVRFFNLLLSKSCVDSELSKLIDGIKSDSIKFRHLDKLRSLRIANREGRLQGIADTLEDSCYTTLQIIDENETPIDRANGFIQLSRAVLASSTADAAVYFEKAIEAVSRFGDEAVERWEAVVNIAKYCASRESMGPEYAYRFMRCAELIGNTVAREKHWDRDDAIKTCFQLSPVSSFSIASRWNDRGVGRPGRMLAALLEIALIGNAISPSSAWAISALPFDYDLVNFAGECIKKEKDIGKKQIILNDLIKDYRQRGVTGDKWQAIATLAKSNNLHHEVLDQLDLLIDKNKEAENLNSIPFLNDSENVKATSEELYGDIDFLSDNSLREALNRSKAQKAPRDYNELWRFAASKISNTNAVQYLLLIVNAEYLDLYDIRSAIQCFPDNLKKKQGVQKAWPNIVRIIAERYPDDFIRCYYRDRVLEDIGKDDITLNAVRDGVLKTLSESNGLESASTFYGFAGSCVEEIGIDDAKMLFDFALSRFELHIDREYADGPWIDSLHPPEHITTSLTGYIWGCLGSPESFERWSAAHVVRRLYQLGCQHEIDLLVEWMSGGDVKAFIGSKHIFYNLHAKQYLLISLARCAVDTPIFLVKHAKVFSDLALHGENHILIQKYSADIALAIAKDKPTYYDSDTVGKLKQVTNTPFPIEITDDYFKKCETPWHKRGEVDTSIDLSFGHDFDSYWFEPLGDVFKIPKEQVEELAAEVILKDWKLSFSERYIRDPRQGLWNSRRDRSTWQSRSEYPKTDTYTFYLSYHAMMAVAGKLLKAMPFINSRDWDKDEWNDWLGRHLLTRTDGRWLADQRDFIPAVRRQWQNDKTDSDWCWQIWPKDFLEVLLYEQSNETWLNVAGSWDEYKDGHNESMYISSRLVPSLTSTSLLQAATHYHDSVFGGSSLANFEMQDFDGDYNHKLFELVKWYTLGDSSKGVDEFDPYAGAIDYPFYMLDLDIGSQLDIYPNDDGRYWKDNDSKKVVLISQVWSEDKPLREENDYCSKGNRLQSSLTFLKKLLNKLNMNLVIQVDIKRDLTGSYRREDNNAGYAPPYRKFYILSKDGRLRDAKTSFILREKTS
tara:strand:+ start:1852 stop:8193 length:6342 start_codon:yes stop_codon:yes gene_type:complete